MLLTLFVLLSTLIFGCHGDDPDTISHLILIDDLPATLTPGAHPQLEIRTNFSGGIEFHESEEFKVLLNITAPSIQDAYAVTADLIDHKGKLLLQVHEKVGTGLPVSLRWIFIVIGALTSIVFIIAVSYVVYWYSRKKHLDYYTAGYLKDSRAWRSRNSVQFNAGDQLLGDLHNDDVIDGEEDGERERRKLEKLRVSLKPETIIEESEDSTDDDRTNLKSRFQLSNRHLNRQFSLRCENPVDNSNLNGSGLLDYPNQTDDEDSDNNLSPDQKILDANGSYTPLDDVDDLLHENDIHNSQSTAKLHDPKGNLDYNIQTSRSEGDLLGSVPKKMSEKEKQITPLKVAVPAKKKSPSKGAAAAPYQRAEPNIYQRGLNLPKPQALNLRAPQNDLNSDQSAHTRVQVHSPENPYVNNSHGQYVALMQTPSDNSSRSRISRESNDAYEMYTYSADIPLSTFKGPAYSPSKGQGKPVPKPKPKPMFTSGSPNAFDFDKLQPRFKLDKLANQGEPISPGNFSMLRENTDSDSMSDDDELNDAGDSDLEDLPPLEPDAEVLSNDSLPLPSPPLMEGQFFSDTHPPPMLQLSPRQDDEDKYGTVIALTGSPSPGGPYSKHSVNQGESRFVFPPPPMMYTPQQQGAWSRRELAFADEGEYVEPKITHMARRGEYVEPHVMQAPRRGTTDGPVDSKGAVGQRKKGEDKPSRERRTSGGSRKGGGGKAPKHLHLTMLTTLTILSVMSGVYCISSSSETQVNIIVYVPPSFPYKNSTIYTGVGKTVHLHKYDGMKWLSANDPILHNFNSTWCSNKRCLHGCDDNTGYCICNHGYVMIEGECKDLNECQNGMSRCSHPQSGCANYPGSYDCLCLAAYKLYNFKDKCLDCSVGCEKGTYEVQPCLENRPKVCKECTKSCGENYYMKQRCANKTDAACRICDPLCNATNNEYEFTQCSAYENRACKDKSTLPAPMLSSNIILDDLTATGDEYSNIPYHSPDSSGVTIKLGKDSTVLGTDSWIDLEIKYFKPISQFRSVNHSDSVLDSDLARHKDILGQCAYPVPKMYNLTYIKHMGVSYKGDTSQGLDSIEPCEGNPYSFPNLDDSRHRSVFCTEPGPLSDVFQNLRSENYEQTETTWEESSELCAQRHEACENCSRNCVQEMPSNNDECMVKATDENDRSPRLPLCLSCCASEKCEDECRNYHSDRCRVIRCTKGNIAQFELRPVYPTGGAFLCHVKPILGQQLVKVQYTAVYWHQREKKTFVRELIVNSDETWQTTGKTSKKDDIIEIMIDSHITEIPDFIQSSWGGQNLEVGKYQAVGRRLVNTAASANYVFVRPDVPFGVNPKQFGKQKCEDMTLENVVMATSEGQPMRLIPGLLAVKEEGVRDSYLILNRTKMPVMGVRLNKNTSILRAVYHPKKLVFGTLAGQMVFNGTHWLATVTAVMEDCPGFLSLNISDVKYPNDQLYQFHLGYECPKDLNLTVMIPTGDTPLLSKNIQVHVRDEETTYVLTIHAPAQITEEQLERQVPIHPTTEMATREIETTEMSTLFVAIVCGVVMLLVAMLAFGAAWKQGIPEGNIQRFHMRHLVLLVIYITFQFLYAAVVSMTVFVFIVIAVNGQTTTFLKQYNQQRSVTAALSQLDLNDMEFHLQNELLRQKNEASDRKFKCQENIRSTIENVQKMFNMLDAAALNAVQKKNLTELVINHTQTAVEKFSREFVTFRDEYRKFSTYAVNKLYNEVKSTISSIEDSKWLKGAQFLYNFVSINKKLLGGNSAMMPFMEWVDMDTNILKKFKDVRVDLPDLPVLQDSLEPVMAASQRKTRLDPISTQTINQWFIQPGLDVGKQNMTDVLPEDKRRVTSLDPGSYSIFIFAMIIIDLLWMLHRMVKACGIGKLLLYGYPIYVDVREQKDGEEKKKLNKTPKLKMMKNVVKKILSTLFIPKLIAFLFVGLILVMVSMTSEKFINRKTFNYLGYYNDLEEVLSINELVINARIGSHADRINRLEFPMFEDAMNGNLQNHQYVLNMIETQWNGIMESHSTMFCNYLRKTKADAECDESYTLTDLKLDACIFNPVVPKVYHRVVTSSSQIASEQLDAFLTMIRQLVSDTTYIVTIYMAIVIIKELLGTVLWIYMKRSGFVSLRIIYETDEAPGSADTSTTNK